eukprot:6303930-Pyramimonas_sp.AAC.1
MSKASNISRCAYHWKVVKNEKGEMERAIRARLGLRGFHRPRSLRCIDVLVNGAAVKPAITRQRGGAQKAVDRDFFWRQHGLPERTYVSRARCSDQ